MQYFNPYVDQRKSLQDLLRTPADEILEKLLDLLTRIYIEEDLKEMKEFVVNMSAENRHFYDLRNTTNFDCLSDETWKEVVEARVRNGLCYSYTVVAGHVAEE